MNFFAKRKKEKEEKRKKEEAQRRIQLIEKLKADTAESLQILRQIEDHPRKNRSFGVHVFHFNTKIYWAQRVLIIEKLREAEAGSAFDFTLEDVGTSKEELDDIMILAVKADIRIDGEELGLVVTDGAPERSRSVAGNVVGSVEL